MPPTCEACVRLESALFEADRLLIQLGWPDSGWLEADRWT